jgi:sugar phosphate isomerase/epimerase
VNVSISQITTVSAGFAEDVAAYAAAGATGLGVWEMKLTDDEAARRELADAGLAATHCVPTVPSILPLPLMPEAPTEPEARVDALRASIRRLAAFEPACVLCLTGPGGELDAAEARRLVVEGLRTVAEEAAAAGVPFAVEPIQPEFRDLWSLVSGISETVALLEDVGRGDVGIMFDTWHLWNTDDLLGGIEREVGRFRGVHVADWRDPTRNTNDRVMPGDGVANLGEILAALDRAGYDGWYDVEIFSDAELEDSLWRLPPDEAARRAVAGLRRVWAARPAA